MITNIQFVENSPRFLGEEKGEVSNLLNGYLLLTESKVITKKTESSKAKHAENAAISRTKLLRKLHLVEIQQTLTSSKKGNEVRDKIEQIDALAFGEEVCKLTDFVRVPPSPATKERPTYFVFMMNKERIKSNGLMKMFSVKIKWSR